LDRREVENSNVGRKIIKIGKMMVVVESMDGWMWLSLIVNQVPFLANTYAEGNKFYSILLHIPATL